LATIIDSDKVGRFFETRCRKLYSS